MRFLKVAFVLAIALSLTASVYAETQSVKVSGDLTVRGFIRDAYDQRASCMMWEDANARTSFARDGGSLIGAGTYPGAHQSWWMSQAEIQVDAELTDCVSASVRILNERDWNVQNKALAQGGNIWPNGFGGYQSNPNEFNVNLDLAYVTLKNFIYQPLTVSIGRQDLWFGKGFIVGTNQLYNNWINNQGVFAGNTAGVLQSPGLLNAPEYTAMTAFDSFKAVLDYDPWTITGVYAAILTNSYSIDDGVSLWGINVGYKFDCYKAEAEAYWFFKNDKHIAMWNGGTGNQIHTLGMRGSMDPIDALTLSGEIAFQVGKYQTSTPLNQARISSSAPRAAWAMDVAAEYRGLMDKVMWKPKIGTEFILYSGDQTSNNNTLAGTNTTWTGWDPMFRGKFDSAIREFVGMYYATYDYPAEPLQMQSVGDASYTNQNQLVFSGSLEPMDCLTLKGNYNMFWTYTDYRRAFSSDERSGYIGSELDLQAIWDYTEDVSFGLLAAWFYPGYYGAYDGQNIGGTPTDVVGTVKVSF